MRSLRLFGIAIVTALAATGALSLVSSIEHLINHTTTVTVDKSCDGGILPFCMIMKKSCEEANQEACRYFQ